MAMRQCFLIKNKTVPTIIELVSNIYNTYFPPYVQYRKSIEKERKICFVSSTKTAFQPQNLDPKKVTKNIGGLCSCESGFLWNLYAKKLCPENSWKHKMDRFK